MVRIVADNMDSVLIDPALVVQINGRDGVDGKDGINGQDGKPGRDGVDGKNGRDGVDGKDGKDGTSCWIEYDKKTSTLTFKNDGGKKNPDPIKLPPEAKGWGYGAGVGRGGVTAQANYDEKNKNAVDFIKNKPQVEDMPEANKKNLGKIVQYVGEDSGYYQHGYVYECFEKEDHTFGWKRIDTQPGGSRGRFLSLWNSKTGLAETNPPYSPYPYQTGDFFIVSTVDDTTNYRPNGTEYVEDTASTTVETEDVAVDDTYYFDGTSWKLQHHEEAKVKDVKLEGSSASLVSNGIATIPYSKGATYGVVRAGTKGVGTTSSGDLQIVPASTTQIDYRAGNTYAPITCTNFDYILSKSIVSNTQTLDSTGKTAACAWIGAGEAEKTDTLASTASITLADNTVYSDGGSGVSSLTVATPATYDTTFVSTVNFTSGNTPTTYSATGISHRGDDCNTSTFVFTPTLNKRYTIMYYYDGVSFWGIVKGD